MSPTSLWRMDGNPPLGQLRACSIVNLFPQTQWDGRCCGFHPYLKHNASLKAPLWRVNTCSSMGSVESQLDEPFSVASSIALC